MSEQKKKPGILKIIFGLITIIALFYIIGLMVNTANEDIDKKAVSSETKKNENNTTKKLTLEEKTSQIVKDKLGKKSNNDKKRIVKVSTNDSATGNGKIINLDLNADENLTTKMTKSGMLMDAAKVMEPISKTKNVDIIRLRWYYTMVDTYGKEKDEPIMKIEVNRETLDKINWKNFDYNNFKDIADSYWEHTALSKK